MGAGEKDNSETHWEAVEANFQKGPQIIYEVDNSLEESRADVSKLLLAKLSQGPGKFTRPLQIPTAAKGQEYRPWEDWLQCNRK